MVEQRTYLCSVIQCEKISSDIYLVTLEAPKDQLFNYQPGQYLFINMAEDDARPYSIASVPGNKRTLQMHIKDIPGNDFTDQVLQMLKSASHVNISLAAGACTIERSSGIRPLLFIAGGTGYAHCHPIIQNLLDMKDNRAITLYWGAHSSNEFYLRDIPEQWMTQHRGFIFVPVINDAGEDWSGEKGMVHEAVFRNIDNLSNYDIYLSGSSAMVFNIYRLLRTKDVPSEQIFSDMLDILRDEQDLD